MKRVFHKDIITITGPSGAGKTTLVQELLKTGRFHLVTSYTTREPRSSDIPGEYTHTTDEEFDRLVSDGSFAWSVDVHGKRYGTLRSSLQNITVIQDRIRILIVTPDIALRVALMSSLQTINVFLIPPDETEQRRRLVLRGDREQDIERRIADCKEWIKEADELGIYLFISNSGTKEELCQTFLSELFITSPKSFLILPNT